jgi:hypothetical protein
MSLASSIVNAVIDVPAADGSFPGGTIVKTLLGYGRYLVLALGVGAIFYGGGAWAWSKNGNAAAAGNGRTWVVGGMIAAILAGVAPVIIDKLYNSSLAG